MRIIREHSLAGLVLLVRNPPTEEWFERTTKLLETTAADLIVVRSEQPILPAEPDMNEDAADARIGALPPVSVRELQRGSLLLHPGNLEWTTSLVPFREWKDDASADHVTPRFIVLPPSQKSEPATVSTPAPEPEPTPAPEPAPEPTPPPAPEPTPATEPVQTP